MGLDVGDRGALGAGQRVEGADLVEHLVGELGGIHVDEAAAEARDVAVAHVRAHGDPACGGRLDGAGDVVRIAGVEAAGDVGARHHLDDRGVVAHGIAADGFAQVGVHIDGGHDHHPSRRAVKAARDC